MNNLQHTERLIHPSLKGLEGFFNLFESSCTITQKNQAGSQTVYEFPTYSLRYNKGTNRLFVTGPDQTAWKTIELKNETTFGCKRYGKLSSLIFTTLEKGKEIEQIAKIAGIRERDIGGWCIATGRTNSLNNSFHTVKTQQKTNYQAASEGSDSFLETDPNSIFSNSSRQGTHETNNQTVGRLNTSISKIQETNTSEYSDGSNSFLETDENSTVRNSYTQNNDKKNNQTVGRLNNTTRQYAAQIPKLNLKTRYYTNAK
jgi:hypothetical protein